MIPNIVGAACIVGFFCFLLILVWCSYQLRRRKYRQIANGLGAEYQPQGLFKSGKIAGASNHRKYSVETEDRGRAGAWTTIRMQCLNRGIPLFIDGNFFKSFPNWNYAFTTGERTERLFFTHIALHNVGIPLEDEPKIEVQGLFQEFALLNYAFLRKGHLRIEQDTISFTIRGALKSLEAVREILPVLTRIADRIESEPIGNRVENQEQEPIPASVSVTLRRRATPTEP